MKAAAQSRRSVSTSARTRSTLVGQDEHGAVVLRQKPSRGQVDTSKNPGRIGDGLIHYVRLKTEGLA
jgi:hypothetical protein